MEYLEKTEKLTALRKAIDTTIDQKEKIKLIQETAKILLEINAEKTKNLDKVIMLKEEESSYSAKEMEKIQVKNIISVKEYTEKYGESIFSSKVYNRTQFGKVYSVKGKFDYQKFLKILDVVKNKSLQDYRFIKELDEFIVFTVSNSKLLRDNQITNQHTQRVLKKKSQEKDIVRYYIHPLIFTIHTGKNLLLSVEIESINSNNTDINKIPFKYLK